jgi:hypothetical protein
MSGEAKRPGATLRAAGTLVQRMGGHPLSELRLGDLESDEGLGRWLVAACLLSGRVDEGRALEAYRRLDALGLTDPGRLATAEPDRVARALEAARIPRPLPQAQLLVRAARSLREEHGGSLQGLARGCDGIEELAGALAQLAPGIGSAAVARFLRPLRERWPAAREVPLTPAARAAAIHVGWLREGEDEEGEPAALRAALALQPDAPPLRDAEAALHRLGSAACRRASADRCPLGSDCPLRS